MEGPASDQLAPEEIEITLKVQEAWRKSRSTLRDRLYERRGDDPETLAWLERGLQLLQETPATVREMQHMPQDKKGESSTEKQSSQ